MKPPTLPLDPSFREQLRFCLHFKTVEGFTQEYERQYEKIRYSTRSGRHKLRAKAYELTEQLYCDLIGEGRKYPDQENFFNARKQYLRRQRNKIENRVCASPINPVG